MASRILGMGDVLTLIEKAEAAVDEKKAQELAEKLKKNRFTLTDYLDQLNSMKNMGSLQELAGMVPGWTPRRSPVRRSTRRPWRTPRRSSSP